ncbi:hypothetical protein C8Q79DRAFT_551536 [Trametes meyenii]|nr:hypothetical protein C8Q79DRAFT_551536 [Trametes meyenii]
MASTTTVHVPRPTVKRASRTWPGDATARSHFEDFLREIGVDSEAEHLCCKGTSSHNRHPNRASTAPLSPKTHVPPTTADNTTSNPAFPRTPTDHRLSTETQVRPSIRGRTISSRSHFEDFIREIGGDTESMHLCCRGTSPHPHVHAHMRRGSAASVGPKSRSSPTRAHDKARASPEEGGRRLSTESQARPVLSRGRAASSSRASSLPIHPKSPAFSYVDLETHDATPTYNHLASARDALLVLTGGSPVDERPSRAPIRTFFHDRAPASRSPDSASNHSPLFAADPSAEQHSRPRMHSSPRSASPTPSVDSLDTASSSEAPATPRTHTMLAHELPHTLDDLERASRFRVESRCVRCHRSGSNFPSCAKCGEMWCSRECRLQGPAATGRTHACHGRSASA